MDGQPENQGAAGGGDAEMLRMLAANGARLFTFRARLRSVVWAIMALSIFFTALSLLWRLSSGGEVKPGALAGWTVLAVAVLLWAPKDGAG